MDVLLKLVVGVIFAAGFYLILQRGLPQLVLGFALLTNAANLLVFVIGGISRAGAPVVDQHGHAPAGVDPLPQALVLTAIVIGFGVIAFTLALAYRFHQRTGIHDIDRLTTTDRLQHPGHHRQEDGG
jgi:multicomponent Na+:H+ antiporter subunit C